MRPALCLLCLQQEHGSYDYIETASADNLSHGTSPAIRAFTRDALTKDPLLINVLTLSNAYWLSERYGSRAAAIQIVRSGRRDGHDAEDTVSSKLAHLLESQGMTDAGYSDVVTSITGATAADWLEKHMVSDAEVDMIVNAMTHTEAPSGSQAPFPYIASLSRWGGSRHTSCNREDMVKTIRDEFPNAYQYGKGHLPETGTHIPDGHAARFVAAELEAGMQVAGLSLVDGKVIWDGVATD